MEPIALGRGGLSRLLRAAADRPGLCCLDLGLEGTFVSWASEPARARLGSLPDLPSPLLPGPEPELPPQTGPLHGGHVGWLGYELGAAHERMPVPRKARWLPDLACWPVEGGIGHDRRSDTWWMGGSPRFRAEARRLLASTTTALPGEPPIRNAPPPPPPGTEARYQDAVREALDEIRRGNIYQVNLAWALDGPASPDPIGAWLALRAHNPARQGALLRWQDSWILCNSPERYLLLRPTAAPGAPPGWNVESVPIKGTARRSGGVAAYQELLHSDKEQAELTMIVDLVRNDLGRVAEAGSVRPGARRIVSCGDLWHAERAVRARLRPGLDLRDLVASSFPPGSVTGAPKVAAMEIIGRLEPEPRGIYTGSIFLLARGGRAWFNVAIRTATTRGDRCRIHVGAGIVADSVPEREWEETLAKGDVLARHVFAPEPR